MANLFNIVTLCLVFVSCQLKPVASDDLETLEMVHVLYRHGDRSPVSLYPKDPYKEKSSALWPEGLGQLTKIGKKMEYNLGLWLRNRYNSFISKVFNTDEINIKSTDYDRTLMSAQCVLAGFYMPDNETRFIESLPWVPVPVHTSAKEDDMLLNVDSSCPRISKEMSKVQKLKEIRDYYEQHKALFKTVADYSGANITTALELEFVFDTLRIEQLYNLTIPQWAIKNYDEMKTVSDFSFKITSYTHELKRLRGGPLLSAMAENMLKKSHGDLPKRKMFMYSAHDTTVASLLNAMGVFNNLFPPYASTVLVELYQRNKQYFVKMAYQNDSTMANAPHTLIIPGCSVECPLSNWTDLLSNVTPKNWSKECYRPDPVMDHYFILGLTGGLVLLILILITVIILLRKRIFSSANGGYQYEALGSEEA